MCDDSRVEGLCSFAPVRHLFHEIQIDRQQIMENNHDIVVIQRYIDTGTTISEIFLLAILNL